MPIGVSSPYYLAHQPTPRCQIVWEDSYLRMRLADVQAFFPAGLLVKVGTLVVSSSVRSTFQPDVALESVHQITSFEKNVPQRVAVRTNLTDWLPARTPDSISLTLQYTVVQDAPFAQLVGQIGQAKLSSAVSLFRADWAAAVRVSEIAGRILSVLLREGSRHELLQLTCDFNQANLRAGQHALLATSSDEYWPPTLEWSQQYGVADPRNGALQRHSFAVLEIQAIPRMEPERARDEPWWELLDVGRSQVLDAYLPDDAARQEALEQWRRTLVQVRALARKARGFLASETAGVIRAAQRDVDAALFPHAPQSRSLLPEPWREVLGVASEGELAQVVRDYDDAVALTRDLLHWYDGEEGR